MSRQIIANTFTNSEPPIKWSFAGPDREHFKVTPTTSPFYYEIEFAAKDFELPQDADADNVYDLFVTATNPEDGGTSTITWRIVVNNTPDALPLATNIQITGINTVGQSLRGNFSYSDTDGDAAGAHQYRWYRADNSTGTLNKTRIDNATSETYTLVAADQGKYIVFEVIPVSITGTPNTGVAVSKITNAIIQGRPPIASNITITGTVTVGQNLVGSFNYSDADGDLAAAHQYRWYRTDNANGTGNKTLVGSDTNYTLVNNDYGKYISLEITPISRSGAPNVGNPVTVTTINTVMSGIVNVGTFTYAAYLGNINTYSSAVAICNDLDKNGYTDWRLPSIDELQAYYNAYPRSQVGSLFGWQTINGYISSTVYSAGRHHIIFFQDGKRSFVNDNQTQYGNVACIR